MAGSVRGLGMIGCFAVTLIALLCFLLARPAFAQLRDGAEAGTVERVSGEVTLTDTAARPAREGDTVRVGDLLATARGAEALIRFRDDSTMALRPDTQVRITDFRHQDPAGDSFVARMIKGTMRSVSGLIARARPRGVQFHTPTATIGIRGTDFEVAIIPAGERDRAGIYNFVHDGSTSIAVPTGESLDVQRDETGFAPDNPQPGEPVLQLLRERPAFLRGGGFDAMMRQVRPPPMQQIFIPRGR